MLLLEQPLDHFHLPLSVEAFHQYNIMQDIMHNVQLNDDSDLWIYMWGTSFSSIKAYNALLGWRQVHPIFNWLWQSSTQLKHEFFFFWLLLNDRLNTRGLLRRKNMVLDSYTCELCIIQRDETLNHLFLHCSFARNCWAAIGINLNIRRQPIPAFNS